MKHFVILFIVLIVFKVEAQSSASSTADSLYLLGNYTKAINAYAELGTQKSSLQIARAYNALGNKEKAIMQYKALVKNYPKNTLAKFELGKLYDKSKKYQDAAGIFQELTSPESQNPEFYYYLGKTLQLSLDTENANKALKKAIALDSTHVKSIYLLGRHYYRVQEPLKAKEILDLGLKTTPNNIGLINLKALVYFNNGDYEDAISLFERLIELREIKPYIFKKLGFASANRWQYDKAKDAYRNLSAIPEQEADGYFGLAEVFLKEKKLDSAEIYYKKSIEEQRYIFDKEYSSLGRVYRLKGEFKKAIEYYTKAWEEDKTNQFNYWQICVLADEYYKDPKVKLNYYENLVSNSKLAPFLKERAAKRIRELKEEIHFAAD